MVVRGVGRFRERKGCVGALAFIGLGVLNTLVPEMDVLLRNMGLRWGLSAMQQLRLMRAMNAMTSCQGREG